MDFLKDDKKRETAVVLTIVISCLVCLALGTALYSKQRGKSTGSAEVVNTIMKDKIVVIGLEGPIFDSLETSNPFIKSKPNAVQARKELKKALEDPYTKAVIIRANSPGGTVGTSQELYKLVLEFRKKKKPVVISMSDVCASGCYYLASASDLIVANPGTLTGSIGVITQGLNFTGLMARWGIADQTFKAGRFKDMGSGLREMSIEERAVMQSMLNDSYRQFLDDVSSARGIDRAKLETLAQGLIYTGNQAKQAGLVDELGTYDEAKALTRKLLKDKYKYSKASSIAIVETWSTTKITDLDDIFNLGLGSQLSKLGLGELLSGSHSESPSYSSYQPLWLMP